MTAVDTVSLSSEASGRMAEQNGSTQVIYSPTEQILAMASNQGLQSLRAAARGATAVYNSSSLAYYQAIRERERGIRKCAALKCFIPRIKSGRERHSLAFIGILHYF